MLIERSCKAPEEIYEAEICRTRRLLQIAKQNLATAKDNDLYAAQVANFERRLRLLRLPTAEDIRYRSELASRLPISLKKHARSARLRFHGSPIGNVSSIIKSGIISSAVDHDGTRRSSDVAGQISITTCENVGISIRDYMGINDYAVPLGCLFVIEVSSAHSFANWNMPNVPLRGNHLCKVRAILSSPESSCAVEKMLAKYGYNHEIASECYSFCK